MDTGYRKLCDGMSGRQMFLAQRARLRAIVTTTHISDTASRYNRLGETQRGIIFTLANEAAAKYSGLPYLDRNLARRDFEELSAPERRVLFLGIKLLSELAGAIPWIFDDIAAPVNEATPCAPLSSDDIN